MSSPRQPKGPPPEPPDLRAVAVQAVRSIDLAGPVGRYLLCDPVLSVLIRREQARVQFDFLWDGGSPVPALKSLAERHGRSIRQIRRWLDRDTDPG